MEWIELTADIGKEEVVTFRAVIIKGEPGAGESEKLSHQQVTRYKINVGHGTPGVCGEEKRRTPRVPVRGKGYITKYPLRGSLWSFGTDPKSALYPFKKALTS